MLAEMEGVEVRGVGRDVRRMSRWRGEEIKGSQAGRLVRGR
jgi:hypothetical protein